VRPCAGRPLIEWTLEAACASNLDDVLISTNDPEVVEIASRWPGVSLRRRPDDLGQDDTPMPPVVVDALDYHLGDFDAVCVLQPTTPLRTSYDINDAIGIMMPGHCDSVVSMVACGDDHPDRTCAVENGRITAVWAFTPRQQLPARFRRAGSIYLSTVALWRSGRVVGGHIRSLEIPRSRAVNIDTETDFILAEVLLNASSRHGND
jgi:CMP-N-acetylneuraminic acid synthetase